MATTLIGIIINIAVLFVFFLYFRRRIEAILETKKVVEHIRSEVDDMIVELNQTADRNIGLMEERLTRLSALVSEADRRITVLKKESDRGKSAEAVYTHLKPLSAAPSPRKEPEVQAAKKSPREEVLELYRQGLDAREIAGKVDKTLGEVELIISLGVNRK
jgi:Family of unknown function (DUF6115)